MNEHSLLLIGCAICTLVGVWMLAYDRGRIDGLSDAQRIINEFFKSAEAKFGAEMAKKATSKDTENKDYRQ